MAASKGIGESAIIVPVELPMAMRRLRDRLDPSAADGVPAHITLLFPFAPAARLDDATRAALARIVATEPAFPFMLDRVGRWPDVVYLAPEPAEPFRRLIERLTAEFPDYPPYGGEHADIVPHLTVAQSERTDYLDAAEHALPALLPVRAVCREAWLIAHVAAEPWHDLWKLPLAAR